MELALIRHTRCEIAAGTCYGHLDVPLADTAAADIALTLSRVPPVDLVFSSPSRRCHALAQALVLRDACEMRISSELRELNFGSWEGLRWDDIPRATSDAWSMDTWNIAPPGGESESVLWQRVARVADELLKLRQTKRIAIVSHGGPLRHLRCLLTGTPASERWSWACNWGDVALIAPRESACPSSDP
jgi:alpha-ribazole phosphatase